MAVTSDTDVNVIDLSSQRWKMGRDAVGTTFGAKNAEKIKLIQ